MAGSSVTADIALVASGDADGSLGGRVTGGGDAVGGSFVAVLHSTDYSLAGGTVSAADGGYRLEGLDPGSYVVFFMDPSGEHAPEWSAGAAGPDDATPVEVVAGVATTLDASLGG